MNVAESIAGFLDRVRRTRAENTWRLYRSRLAPLAEAFASRPLSTLTKAELEAWVEQAGKWPDGRTKAPDTRRATAVVVSLWQAWCVDAGDLAAPIAPRLEKPAGRRRQRIPTDAEREQLLKNASPAFRRMYEALRRTGARPGELCAARIEDWDRPARVIVLAQHKTARETGQPRRIGVGTKLEPLLREAIGDRQAGPIFLDERGEPWTVKRLSKRHLRLRVRAGLAQDLVLYLARHEHGTKIAKSLGIAAAKEALGHTSIKTTERYLHATDAERAANQDAFE